MSNFNPSIKIEDKVSEQTRYNEPVTYMPVVSGNTDNGAPLPQPEMPSWVKNSQLVTPYRSYMPDTLKFNTSIDEKGFTPFDPNLEDYYARNHRLRTFGNNMVQFGGRFLGAAAEAIATIPIVVNAVANKDFSKLYDNDATNAITEWMDGFQNSLPTYQTNYEKESPFLKYISVWDPTTMLNAWGGGINNLGYTAGALAGAFVEDIAITALTGGVGTIAAFGANGVQLTKALSRIGKLSATAPDAVSGLVKAIRAGNLTEDALQTTRQLVRTGQLAEAEATAVTSLMRGEGKGLYQGLENVDDLLNATNPKALKLNRLDNYYKIRDKVKYELAMFTSAAAEGAIEASEVYHRGKEELAQEFRDAYGRDATGEELAEIDKNAKIAGNWTMGANIALLQLSNRLTFGSLFKSTSAVSNQFIDGWFGSVARKGIAKELVEETAENAGKKYAYKLITQTPETRIGKLLLTGERAGKVFSANITEGLEEAGQYAATESTIDYIKEKYDPVNLKNTADAFKSINNGLGKTFGTNEGWDNIVGGFIGGFLGGSVRNGINRARFGKQDKSAQLQSQVSLLNSATFKGFIQDRFTEQSGAAGMDKKYSNAVVEGDKHKAHNIKFDMLFNWVETGIRANSFDKRMDELTDALELEGQSFKDMWGLDDTAENRVEVQNHVQQIREKAENIKNHVEKVERRTKNPHSQGTPDYQAYEIYKTSLALNLSRYDEYQRRINSLSEEFKKDNPLFRIEDAIKMTSVQGISEMLTKLQDTSNNLAQQIAQTEGDIQLQEDLVTKKKAIDNIFGRLQPIVYSGESVTGGGNVKNVKFNGEDYVSALRDLYNLYSGLNIENNKYIDSQKAITDGNTIFINAKQNTNEINDDIFAERLERLQDIYKLSEANSEIGKYYTYLRKELGQRNHMSNIKAILEKAKKTIDDNGNIVTDKDLEDNLRKEAYAETELTPEFYEEDTVTLKPDAYEKSNKLKEAARKTVVKEELTEEEVQLVEQHEELFTNYVEIEENIKEQLKEVKKSFENATETVVNNVIRSTNNIKYEATTPEEILFSLYPNDFQNKEVKKNLHNVIFNLFEKLRRGAGLTVTQNLRDIPRTATQRVNEQNPKNKLYRDNFKNPLELNFDGNLIGEIRPPESIFLDENYTNPLFNKDGEINLTEEQYVELTGNSAESFESFTQAMQQYYAQYNKLKQAVEANKPNIDVTDYFDISIPASFSKTQTTVKKTTTAQGVKYNVLSGNKVIATFDTEEEARQNADTLLSNIEIQNKAVIKLTKIEDVDGKIFYQHEVVFNQGLAQEQLDQLNDIKYQGQWINMAKGSKGGYKQEIYLAVLPTQGNVSSSSFVVGRLLEGETIVNADTIRVSTTPQVFDNATLHINPKGLNKPFSKPPPPSKAATATPVTPAPTINDNAKLPATLASSKPKYNMGSNNFELTFESDIDKAAYIIAGTGKSKAHNEYLRFIMENTGLTENQAILLGTQIRQKIKTFVTGKKSAKILVDKTFKAPVQTKTKEELELQQAEAELEALEQQSTEEQQPTTSNQFEIEAKQEEVDNLKVVVQEQKLEQQYANDKRELAGMLVTYFGITPEQAEASTLLFEQQAKAWAKRNPGKKAKDYYKEIGFGGQELFDQQYNNNIPQSVQFSKKEQTQIQKEVEQLKANGLKYEGKKTNLSEDNWYVVNTPTFINWFGNSNVVDENKNPIVYYHGRKEQFTEFNNDVAKQKSGSLRGQIYLTTEPDFAEDYTDENGDVLELFVKANNVFDYENKQHLALLKSKGPIGAFTNLETTETEDKNWDVLESERVQAFIKQQGFDGFYVKEQGIKNLAVYNPSQVKSIYSAAFDGSTNNIYYQGQVNKKTLIFAQDVNYTNKLLRQGNNETTYNVFENDKKIGEYSITLQGNEGFVSYMENKSGEKGKGIEVFKYATNQIVQQGLTPVFDQYITAYGYKMFEKLAKQGELIYNNIEQIKPDGRKSTQQSYEKPPFSYINSNKEETVKQQLDITIEDIESCL